MSIRDLSITPPEQHKTHPEIERQYTEFVEGLAEEQETDYANLSDPFDDDWDEISEEEKQRYYDACAKEAYIEWCKENPLPRRELPFLIETHIPAHQVHILCGESGAQKTSILLTLLNDWMKGKDVLGRKSRPVPMMFIALDRGMGTVETFQTLGLDHRLFGNYKMSREEFDVPLDQLIRKLKKENPSVGLFVVDSMFIGSPDEIRYKGRRGEVIVKDPYKVTARWLRELDFLCEELKVTIIGLHHAAKNGGAEHAGKRTRALGTVAIAALTGTTLIADLVPSPNPALPRTRWVIRPRNAAAEEFYFDRQEDGSIKLADPEVEYENNFEAFMARADGSYTRAEIEDETGLKSSTVSRYINQAVKTGRLIAEGRGRKTTYLRKKHDSSQA